MFIQINLIIIHQAFFILKQDFYKEKICKLINSFMINLKEVTLKN